MQLNLFEEMVIDNFAGGGGASTGIELYAANGFPADYIIDHDFTGKQYGKTKQVARCGNAVPPPFAEALVRANLPELCGRKVEMMEELGSVMKHE